MRRPPLGSVVQGWLKSALLLATLLTVLLNWPHLTAMTQAAVADMLTMWIYLIVVIVLFQGAWWLMGD
jgi:uncharacterized MnhB-related membrane protein